jgi:transposase
LIGEKVKAYSNDLRIRIVPAYENGEGSQRQLAQRFSVSLSFIQELLRRYYGTGSIEPKPHGGGYPAKINKHALDVLIWLKQQRPHVTVRETCQKLNQDCGIKVSPATVCRAFRKLKKRGPVARRKDFSHLRKKHRKD